MQSLKRYALVSVVLLLGWSLAQVNLTFWSWRTEDVDAYRQFIAAFEAEHPGVTVQFIPYRNVEYNTVLATALQGGRGPDIIHLRSYGGMEQLANAGYLRPLTDEVPALQAFDPGILLGATNRADGEIYGVPFALQTLQVLYNTRIFSELGLEEPATWDEFIALNEALLEAGHTPIANGTADPWTNETFFGVVAPNFYGCNAFYDEVTRGQTDFTDPRFRASIEKMLELRPYLPANFTGIAYTDIQAMFAFEQAAMMLGGSYEFAALKNINPALELGVFPVPPERQGDELCISSYMDGSYGINATTAHPEEALAFIRFLASQAFGQMFADTLQQISAVPGVAPTDPLLAEVTELNANHGTPYLMLTAFRYGQPSGSTLLQNELQAVMAGDKEIDEAVAVIQRGVAEWFEPFQD
jgi:raffinose/stachyose/melibiose transport system substrate-binding protein